VHVGTRVDSSREGGDGTLLPMTWWDRSHALCLCVGLLAGCGDDAGRGGSGGSGGGETCSPDDPVCACPSGFESSAAGCLEIAATDCPPGSRPTLGSTECAPVGWAPPCPSLMEADPTGWGCRPILSELACEGATTERLGEAGCVPIGDCGAPFPPAEATLFVDDDYGAGELDATHFASVADAVFAATSGAVIAVEAGVYLEGFDVLRPVTVVGRCAEDVILQNPGDGFGGVQAQGVSGIHLAGLTLTGHAGGAVFLDSSATIDECLLVDNRGAGVVALGESSVSITRSRVAGTVQKSPSGQWGYGALVQLGADVTIEDSSFVDNHVAGLQLESPGTTVRIVRSVIRDTLPSEMGSDAGRLGAGIAALDQAALEVEECAIVDNRSAGVHVDGAGTGATVVRTVVSGTRMEADGTFGGGVLAVNGGLAQVSDSAMVECAGFGLGVAGMGSSLTAARVTVRGAIPFDVGRAGVGVVAAEQGTLLADDIAVVAARDAGVLAQDVGTTATLGRVLVQETELGLGNPHGDGIGVTVNLGSVLDLQDAALLRNRLVGLAVRSADPSGATSQATARRVLVTDTLGATDGSFGHGLHVAGGGTLTFEEGAVTGSRQVGAVADEAAILTLASSVVRSTVVDGLGGFGYGVLGLRGATVSASGTTVRDHESAALVFSDSTGGFSRSVVATSAIAIQAQDGTTVAERDTLPSPLEPLTATFTDTRFVDNTARLGTGALPLPAALE
jgi:hypothetical protein